MKKDGEQRNKRFWSEDATMKVRVSLREIHENDNMQLEYDYGLGQE